MARELKIDSQIQKAVKETIVSTKYPILNCTGLFLYVEVSKATGKKTATFRHRYSHPFTDNRPTMTLGTYPAFTLEHARQKHSDNLALLAQDIDPIEYKKNLKQKEITDRKNTLQYFIDEWQTIQAQKSLAPDTYRKQRDNIKYIQQKLGKMRVTDIKTATVIDFITSIQAKHTYKGLEIKGVLTAILQLAVIHRVIDRNPCHGLTGALKPHKVTHYPSLAEDTQEFAKLLREIDSLPATKDYLKEILQLIALTFVRRGDVCSMRWADINLFTKQWTFRPQKAGEREDMNNLVTPLAPQAIAILERMQALTGGQEYVFYNGRRKLAKYTDPSRINQLLNGEIAGITLNNGMGYKGLHTPHGYRSVAKTMLKRMLKDNPLWRDMTELQLGHKVTDRYGGAYDRWDILSERIAMMTDWANYLDDLRAGKIDNVIHFTPAKDKAVNYE